MSRTFTASWQFVQDLRRSLRLNKSACFRPWAIAIVAAVLMGGQVQAQTILSAQALLEPDGLEPTETSVNLPHRWDRHFPGRGGKATYKLDIPARKAAGAHGLYIPRVGNQVEVRLGQRIVFAGGTLGDSGVDMAKPPLWIDLQTEDLNQDGPTPLRVVITVQASRWGGLAAPTFGPKAELYPKYLKRYRWRQFGGLAVTIAMSLASLMAAGLWWYQREALYGYFSLGASCGALRFCDRLITEPPLPWPLWGLLIAFSMLFFVGLMLWFILIVVKKDGPRTQRLFLFSFAALLGMAVWAFTFDRPDLWTHALTLTLGGAITVLFVIVRVAWFERTQEAILIGTAGFIECVAGLYDNVFIRRMNAGFEGFSILPLASLALVLLLGWLVVNRFARETRAHRDLFNTLNSRVQAREKEIEAHHALLGIEHAHKATLLERQRIMRDIHDGVGAQLVGLLSLLKAESTSRDTLREQTSAALDEMRMAVDATQPVHGELVTVLATLRYRLQPRLEAAGIEVSWRVDELPRMEGLTPQVVLQLQRILMEAFTNVIRHAQASRLSVTASSFQFEGSVKLRLTVEDNGRGLAAYQAQGHGMGLSNMQARAVTVGATIKFSQGSMGGAKVLLEMPIQGPLSQGI